MSLFARIWFGKTPIEGSEEYLNYVRETGVKDLNSTEGNRGVLVLRRAEEETVEIGVISFWESIAAVRRFSGEDISKAVYYPKDADYLVQMEPELVHFDVPVARGVNFRNGKSVPDVESIHKDDVKAESPFPGVRIRRLWKGRNGAGALLVEIDPGCGWQDLDVHEPGPEEVYVVSGVFHDGKAEYPAGSFIHNAAGTSHVPQSSTGCVLFIFYPEG